MFHSCTWNLIQVTNCNYFWVYSSFTAKRSKENRLVVLFVFLSRLKQFQTYHLDNKKVHQFPKYFTRYRVYSFCKRSRAISAYFTQESASDVNFVASAVTTEGKNARTCEWFLKYDSISNDLHVLQTQQSADAACKPYAYEKRRSFFRKNEQRVEGRELSLSPSLSLSLSVTLLLGGQVAEDETHRLELESGLCCDELAGSIPGVRPFHPTR